MRCAAQRARGCYRTVTDGAAACSFPVGYDVDGDDDDDDSDEEDSDEDEEDEPRAGKKSGACSIRQSCAVEASAPMLLRHTHALRVALTGVVIKELPAGADDDEEEEEEEEEEAPPARGKPNPADHSKNFLPLDAKKRPAAAPAATPPAKKAAPAPAASPAAAAKPAPSPAGAANGKLGSQFSDGPAGTLGARKFDNGRTRPAESLLSLLLPTLTHPFCLCSGDRQPGCRQARRQGGAHGQAVRRSCSGAAVRCPRFADSLLRLRALCFLAPAACR